MNIIQDTLSSKRRPHRSVDATRALATVLIELSEEEMAHVAGGQPLRTFDAPRRTHE